MDQELRNRENEDFLKRLLARRPHAKAFYEPILRRPESTLGGLEAHVATKEAASRAMALETIVARERPVLFVRDGRFDTEQVTILGVEAKDLVDQLMQSSAALQPLLPLVGRIDVTNLPGFPFVGTGWLVDTEVVVTNRHVAEIISHRESGQFIFSRGAGGRTIEPSLCNAHEFDDLAPDATRVFKIEQVLYIDPNPDKDIAFLKIKRKTDGVLRPFIEIAKTDAPENQPVCVIGYPARASQDVIPDQNLMHELFRGKYDVKRAAPGFSMGTKDGSARHDCSTLGGSSGSVVLDLSGKAVGLHFAGLFREANYAVPAKTLSDYVNRKLWGEQMTTELKNPVENGAPQVPAGNATGATQFSVTTNAGAITISIPLTVTVALGTPTVVGAAGDGNGQEQNIQRVEQAVLAYWDSKPEGVLAVRVGYLDNDDRIGDRPCVAVSVKPDQWARFESDGLKEIQGVPVRYFPAEVDEQVQSLPMIESVDSIAYDDDARTSKDFSFEPVEEEMDVTLHVGPEYSWDVLKEFIEGAEGKIVSAMYEFHAPHIMKALQKRLDDGASLKLVLDNATFSKVKSTTEEFDRVKVFDKWTDKYDSRFQRVVAPEGTSGLISDSYHIKVTVRSDGTFWHSSGNWKAGSSQPVITDEERSNATVDDLRGNREWHVVIKNKSLAGRFRSHILQDFAASVERGGGPLPKRLMEETFVDVPIEEAVLEARRPPSRIIKPKKLSERIKVRPLLTPDKKGAIFSKAVLSLIRSAKTSLWFQIPYIGMPSNPRQSRGFIDDLIGELTDKLTSLEDARVILRAGGQKFSSPAHAAWFFKSKGVHLDDQLRVIDNHHTKGMIVDGKHVLLGSHNWSKPGVTLNRDASLIFYDNKTIADYYGQAFEIDWARANKLRPRRFVKTEMVVREAVGVMPPPGYVRVTLSELLKDD